MAHDTSENLAEWNSDTTYALGLYKILTKILGIWPPKCEDIFSKIRASMLVSLIGEVMSESSAINDVIEVISLLLCAVLTLLKVLILRGFRQNMLEIVASAVEDWAEVKSPEARKIMMSHARLGRRVCIFQMTSAYVTTIPMILGALPFLAPPVNVTGSNETLVRGLPLRTVCIFGDMSDFFYATVFILQALQLMATCTGNIGNDVYFFGVTMHICGQFQILGENLKSFEIEADKIVHREKFVTLVKRHVQLSELANHLEDSFNFIILSQLLANALQMSLNGIQMILSLKLGDTLTVINTVIVIYVLSLELYFYSYAADCLSSQIDNIKVSAYFLPWYDLPPTLAKDVLIMIMRNHKRFSITAGKIYHIDIDGFKNFIKGFGSYFSVLRIMLDA